MLMGAAHDNAQLYQLVHAVRHDDDVPLSDCYLTFTVGLPEHCRYDQRCAVADKEMNWI